MRIGAQFYTIREFCQTPETLSESLKKIADIGYKYVQISGTCAYNPEWMKTELKKNGLECVVTHTPADRLLNEPLQVAKDHDIFGCDYIGLGYYPFDESQEDKSYENFIRNYKFVAKTFKENGKYFMYHHHNHEFAKLDGELIIDRLSQDFSADELGFILDTFWIQAAGGDPAWWIEKFSGRVPCIHLKDFKVDRETSVVGEGNINFDRVFEKAQLAGTKYMLVEQDNCYGENPFDCLKRSFNNLKAFGFE